MINKVLENNSADANNKIEAIIRAVAVKHGIALGRNDPILILHTVNGLLLEEFSKQQEINQLHYYRKTVSNAT